MRSDCQTNTGMKVYGEEDQREAGAAELKVIRDRGLEEVLWNDREQ